MSCAIIFFKLSSPRKEPHTLVTTYFTTYIHYKRLSTMRRLGILFLLFSLLISTGCMSTNKRIETAISLEKVQDYQGAFNQYYMVLKRKPASPPALTGAMRSGEQLLVSDLDNFDKARQENNHRKAMEYITHAQHIITVLKPYSQVLSIPTRYNDAIADSQIRATTQYAQFKYDQGLAFFSEAHYRRAYKAFQEVIDTLPTFKDAQQRRARSLELGKQYIAILTPPASRFMSASRLMQTEVLSSLMAQNDPFIEIIDRRHLETILKEHKLTYSGLINDRTSIDAGDISGISSIIYIEVLAIDSSASREKRGTKVIHYVEPQIFEQSYTDTSGQFISRYRVSFKSRPAAVNLFEFTNRVSVMANFQIISVATSQITETKNTTTVKKSSTIFASTNGYDFRSLSTFVPNSIMVLGSEQMAFSRQDQLMRTLPLPYQTSYFTAPQVPRDVRSLSTDALQELGTTVGSQIYHYFNPQDSQ